MCVFGVAANDCSTSVATTVSGNPLELPTIDLGTTVLGALDFGGGGALISGMINGPLGALDFGGGATLDATDFGVGGTLDALDLGGGGGFRSRPRNCHVRQSHSFGIATSVSYPATEV